MHEYSINDPQIVDAIAAKYREFESNDLEIEGVDPDLIKPGDNFSLFEVLFGLGKVLRSDYPLIYGATNDAGETDAIGFTLTTICADAKLSEMATLPKLLENKESKQ